MRIILAQRFLLGRFHANPWKSFVFDDPYGEWPPSPWRLLRALVARSHQYQRENPEIDKPQREALTQAICSSTISWQLPEFSWRGPGLRQYLPTEFKRVPAGAKEPGQMAYGTSKTQDNFWLTPDPAPPLYWIFDTDEQHWTPEVLDHLDACLARMTYFGRAESITDISRLTSDDSGITANCILRSNRTAKTVPILCPLANATLDHVQLTTDDKVVANTSTPPGTIWLFAERPALPKRKARSAARNPVERASTQMMQFALGGRVFPPKQSWIRITEKFRGATLAKLAQGVTGHPNTRFGDLTQADRMKFSLMTGKTSIDTPLGDHQHTYFLLIPDVDGHPTRLICHREIPFTSEEQNAMLASSELPIAWEHGSDDWQLRLVPLHATTPLHQNIIGSTTHWETITPYVPTRHIFGRSGKLKAGYDITSQILADLKHLGLPPAVNIENATGTKHSYWIKVHRPQRARNGQTNDIKRGYHIRLKFEHPVKGPIALGHSAHFGLGLFAPVLD